MQYRPERSTQEVVCPRCGNDENYRIPRTFLQRLLPSSRRYQCPCCERRFLVLRRKGSRRMNPAQS